MRVSSKSPLRERGGVITECVLVIPVMLVLFTGLTELGRTFSQINWVANISYEVAMVGASVSETAGGALAMDGRYAQLSAIPYYKVTLPSDPTSKVYNQTDLHVSGQPPRSVEVAIHATLPTLLSHVSPTFDVRATAPILVLSNVLPGGLSTFSNPNPLYDCCGREYSGAPIDTCLNPPPAC
ncbi:MAG: pilus assembly protein [Deltaproteobacteria bacterium]|nr:pilus assembly protein [Deltaproteobacteria bacterium]